MDISLYLKEINQELERQLAESHFEQPLKDAVNYVMFPGGKRIRPLFSLLLCEDLGGDVKKLLPAAVTVEYIHAASLVHDDLPAMDDDDVRRGRPSCHKAFPEATAILCGDVLMVLPFNKLIQPCYREGEITAFSKVLSEAFVELCNGQQLDLQEDGERNLDKIYLAKTGALFAASAQLAAISAGKSTEIIELCKELGLTLGVYFQIIDDLIDNTAAKGRPESSDEKNHKITAVSDSLEERVKQIKSDIEKILEKTAKLDRNQEFKGVNFIIEKFESVLKK